MISCQKDNPRLTNSGYIYRKINKKAKRQTLEKGFALIGKRYHRNLEALIFTLYIPGINGFELMILYQGR